MFLRKYGAVAVIDGIPLVTRGAMDYKAAPNLAAGDVKISKDGGAYANIEGAGVFGDFVAVSPAAGVSVQVKPDAAALTCKRLSILFIDQTVPKEWEDQEIIVETYGHASAQIIGNLDDTATGTDLATVADYVDTEITAIKTQTDKLLFDASNNVKSSPQTAVTVNPAQVAEGMLQNYITEYDGERLRVRRGAKKKFTFTFNEGFPLAGTEQIYFTAKKDPLEADSAAAINKPCAITSAPNRKCEVELTALEMNIDPRVYKVEVTIFDSGDLTGATARKPIAGEIEVEQNVRLGI